MQKCTKFVSIAKTITQYHCTKIITICVYTCLMRVSYHFICTFTIYYINPQKEDEKEQRTKENAIEPY